MDPTEALRQIKAAVKSAETAMKHGNYPQARDYLEIAAELDNALTARVIAKFIADGGYGPGLK